MKFTFFDKILSAMPWVFISLYLFLSIVGVYQTCNKKKEMTVSELKAYIDSTRQLQNDAGQTIAARKTVEASLQELKVLYKLDSIAKAFDTKAAYISGYVQATTIANAQIKPVSVATVGYKDGPANVIRKVGDTCPPAVAYMQQDFSSPFYKLNVRVGDSAYAKVQSFDTLSLIQTRAFTKSGFLGLKKDWFLDTRVISANPDEHVNIAAAAKISDRPDPFLVVGPSVGYGFNLSAGSIKPTWFVGLTATSPTIKLRRKR